MPETVYSGLDLARPTHFTALLAGLFLIAMGGSAAAAHRERAGTPDAGAISPDASAEDGTSSSESSQKPTADTTSPPDLIAPSNEATTGMAEPAPEAFKLNGYVRGDMYIGKVTGIRQSEIKAGYGEAALIARTKKEHLGDGFAELRLRYGMQGETQQQAIIDVREAYVNTYVGPVDLRLGKQIVVWGRADLLNPTNNLTPNSFRNRSPIEDDRRLGNVGARAFLRLSPVRVEGVWMPMYVANELPAIDLPLYVSYGDPTYPKAQLDQGLLAGRVHLELPGVEMSASYLHGYAPMPGLTLVSDKVDLDNPSIVISRTAYKQQVVGFDFSTALEDLLAIRGEAAYRRPYHYKAPDDDYETDHYIAKPDLQYALGVDHTFGSVSVIAQYLGRYVFDWEKEKGATGGLDSTYLKKDPSLDIVVNSAPLQIRRELAQTSQILYSQTKQIQHLATVRVEWLTAHDTLSISALGMVNFTTKEWMVAPKMGYHLSDSLIAYVGAEILTGPKDTLFGMVDQKLSAGYAELRSTF